MSIEHAGQTEVTGLVWLQPDQQADEQLPDNVRPPAIAAFREGIARARAVRAGQAFAPRRYDGFGLPASYIGRMSLPLSDNLGDNRFVV